MKRRVVAMMVAAVFTLVWIPTMRGGAIPRFDFDNIGHLAQKQVEAQRLEDAKACPHCRVVELKPSDNEQHIALLVAQTKHGCPKCAGVVTTNDSSGTSHRFARMCAKCVEKSCRTVALN
jgi:hypothetical protein